MPYTPDYATWPYTGVLEDRIENAAGYVEAFRRPTPARGAPVMMSRSVFSCTGCHQR